MVLRVRKRAGQEAEDVLEPAGAAAAREASLFTRLVGAMQPAADAGTQALSPEALEALCGCRLPPSRAVARAPAGGMVQNAGEHADLVHVPPFSVFGLYLNPKTSPRGAGSHVEAAEDERVHVFTIASGHMYERLQKIMILSVIRSTKCAYILNH